MSLSKSMCAFASACLAALSVLSLDAGEVKGARFLRFWVFKARSAGSSYYKYVDFHEGNRVGDFRLVKNGEGLDWPSGTVCKYDNIQGFVSYGNADQVSTTSVLDKNDGTSAKDAQGKYTIGTYANYTPNQQMCYTICLPEGQTVDFDHYAVYRGYETLQNHCSPQDWRMEVSANGQDWFPIDEVKGYAGEDWTCFGWYGVPPTPYYLGAPTCSLDLTADGPVLSSGALTYAALPKAVSARQLRWTVTGVVAGTHFHVREFNVALGGVRCARAAGAAVSGSATGVEALFDGDPATGWDVVNDFTKAALVAEIDLGETTLFDGYDFCVAGSETVSGDATPNAWTLEAQDPDTGAWSIIASENAESVGDVLSRPNKCVWRSDYDGFTASTVKGHMFHLSTEGLSAGLLRTAEGFSGQSLSVSSGAVLNLGGVMVSLAPDATVAGTLALDNGVLKGATVEGLRSATVSGTGRISYAAGESVTVPDNADYTVGVDAGVLAPANSPVICPSRGFRFLRLRTTEISNGQKNVTYGTEFALSELEILDGDGNKVFWPAGTKAYRSDTAHTAANALINATAKLPMEGYDKTVDCYPNRLAGGMTAAEAAENYPSAALSRTCVFWDLGSVEEVAKGPAYIIELGAPVEFETYRLFASYNCIGYTRCPTKFTFDASYDGETWYTLDRKEFEPGEWYGMSVNLDHLLFHMRTIDWTAVELAPVDRIADDAVLALASDKTLTLANATEAVGGLSGSGTVAFSGTAAGLVLNGRDESQTFSGAFEGAGVLTINAGVNVFEDVDLSGVTEIVLKPGASLKGTAWTDSSLKVSGSGVFGLKLTAGAVRFDDADVTGVPGDGLAAVAVTGSGRVSFASGQAVQLPSDWPEALVIGGDNGAFTPASSLTIRPNRAFKFLRLRALDIGYGATKSANFEISELDILDVNGDKVFWPEGTVAYRSDGNKTPAMQLIDSPAKLPMEGTGTDTDRYPNRLAAGWTPEEAAINYNGTMIGKTVAIWVLPSVDDVANGPAFIIELGAPVEFETYRLFATYNCIGYARCLQHFTFDASFDGENWFTLDEGQYGTKDWCGANLDHLMFHKRTIDWDARVPHAATDRIADDAAVDLDDGIALNVVSATETIGGIAGVGSVALGGADPVLVLTGVRGDLAFSGAVSGAGTLVLGAGTNTFDDADLSGVTNLILKAGAVVLGTARTTGDLVVVSEGGEWGASFSVGGALTLGGDPLRLPFDVTTGEPCALTAFSYGATDAESKSLFLSSVVEKGPWARRRSFDLKATDSMMTFRVDRYGVMLLVR